MLIISLGLLFSVWTFLMFKKKLDKIDLAVYQKLKIKEPGISIFKVITFFSSTKFLVIVAIFLLLFMKKKDMALAIVLLLISNALLISLFKNLIKRIRPNIRQLVKEKGYSYPSGHTMSATCFYGFLIFLLVSGGANIYLLIFGVMALVFVILLIGFSRIYLGVHYFSDVVGAIMLASCYVLIYVKYLPYLLNWFNF